MFVSNLIFFFSPQKYQYSPNGNGISGRFVKDLFLFPPSKRNFDPLRIVESKDFPIFAPAKTGEIVEARESAFFALFFSSELAQSQMKRGFEGWLLSLFCLCIHNTLHKQWSISIIFIFLFMGVQAQLLEIRISLGGSAL